MKKLLIVAAVSLFPFAITHAEELSYSGRLVNVNGSPVTGSVDLRFDVAYSGAPTATICSKTINGVALTNGVFHASLDIENSDCTPSKAFTAVLRDVPPAESVVLQVTDLTNSKVYPYQALKAVPLSVHANSAKTLSIAGTNGQVLKLVAGEWVAADGGGVGSVTEIQTGSGLSGGPITSSGTISIANSGVTSTHILDGTIVNADISATAAIDRLKIASGTANHVVVNNGAGQLSSVAQLPLSAGGTGAANASDARDNLGLGNSATRDVGLNTGNILLADEVPSCLSHQKIQKTALAPYIFSCVADNDSADSTKLPLAGGTMEGAINMGGFAITNLLDPVNAQDAATRNYVHTYVSTELLNVAESQWETVGSDIHYSAGKVGIGVSSPVGILSIQNGAGYELFFSGAAAANIYQSTASQNLGISTNGGLLSLGGAPSASHLTVNSVGRVGIGTTSPQANLEISSDDLYKIILRDDQDGAQQAGVISFQGATDGAHGWIGFASTGDEDFSLVNQRLNGDFVFGAGNLSTKAIRIKGTTGYVGIGTTTPGAKLEVAGQVKITAGNPGAGKVLTSDASGLATWENPTTPSSGSIDSSHILDGSIVNADISATAAIEQSKIAGLTTDLAAKQAADPELTAVAGLSTDGIMVKTGAGSMTTRTLVGAAGRINIGNNNGVTGNPTIDISTGLLPSPVLGDTGYVLKATGANTAAWSALASGDITGALGFTPINKAGDTMSSGTFTFNGTSVLNVPTPTAATHAVTKAYVDSAISGGNLWTLTSGNIYRNSNVGIGTTSAANAKLTVGGPTALTTDFGTSVLISGAATSAPTDAGTARLLFEDRSASTRIAAMAYGGNLLSFGTLSSTGSVWNNDQMLNIEALTGNVGIGTKTPGARLEVAGLVKITGGTPGAGKVLTSDAAGLATWETPSAGGITALTGEVTASGSGSVAATIANNAVTSAKILDGTIVDADISASAAIAQSKIANLTTDLAAKQASDPELTAVAGLSTDGIMVKTGAGSMTTRTLVGAAGRINIGNNNGVTGNPTIDISTGLLPSPVLGDTGYVLKATGANTAAWSALASGDITGALGFTPVNKAGDTMTGALTLSADPTNNLHAATKQYVDSAVNSSGPWTLSGGNVYRSSGNVGIGTTNPQVTLSLGGSFYTNSANQIHIRNSGSSSRVALGEDNNNHGEMTWHDLFDAMIFNTKRAGTTYTNSLFLKDGNASIGTSNTNGKLTVEGTLSLREGDAPSATANYGKLYVNSSDSKLYFMNDSGTSVPLEPNNTVGSSTTATINFSSNTMVRTTGAGNCGTLAVSGTTSGKTYTLTMPNITATCALPATIDGLPVKSPIGYTNGILVSGVVYSLVNDGYNVWISYVEF